MMYEVKEIKRWVMKQKDQEQMEREKNETRQFLRGPTRVKTESATSRLARKTEKQDDFELDMSGDEFQDDDENPGFDADDEDVKETKERIRREQVAANTFGEAEEDKVEKQEQEEQLEKLRHKMLGKQVVKTLKKFEQGLDFDDLESGDENNPFTDDSVGGTGGIALTRIFCLHDARIPTRRRMIVTKRIRRMMRAKRARSPRTPTRKAKVPRGRIPRVIRLRLEGKEWPTWPRRGN
jgi:hypothetical protein